MNNYDNHEGKYATTHQTYLFCLHVVIHADIPVIQGYTSRGSM